MRTTLLMAACFACALGTPAWALTLGEVDVNSALNQQLSATIPVTGIGPDEQDTLRASIASQAAFERAGLRRDALFDDVNVELVPGPGADRATIKLLSKRRVSEPFLSFLVEVRWAGGGTIREYTVLLDPPNLARAQSSPPAARRSALPSAEDDGGMVFEEDEGVVETVGPGPARRSSSSVASQPRASRSGRSYGPVGRHETLWSIAYAQRPGSSVTMDQMQLAIFRANPQAFDGNMNRMLTGVMLQIPDESEIREISPSAAKAEVARQKTSSYGGRSVARRSSYTPPRTSAAPKRKPAPPPEPVLEPEPPTEPVAEAEAPEPAPAAPTAPESQIAQAPAQPPAQSAAPAPKVEAPVLAPDANKPAADAGAAMVDPETPPTGAPPAAADGGAAPAEGGSAAGGVDPESPPATSPPATAAAPGAEGENLQMPSIWAEGDQPPAEQQQPPASGAATTPPPADTGAGLGGIAATIGEFKMQLLLLVAALVAIAGLLIYRKRKAQEAETPPLPTMDFDEADNVADLEQGLPQAPTAVWQGAETPAPTAAAPEEITSTFDFDALLSGTPAAPPPPPAPAKPRVAAPPPPPAPTPAPAMGKTNVMQAAAIPVRETDYLGEAELHIAYGLYDEAAAVLTRGVEENPTRRDLWLKLLEVYAEAKNSQDYAVAAERFRQQAKPSEGEWAKVVEKGKELAPEAPIFAGGKAAAKGAVTELDLAAFDLPAAEVAPAPKAPAKPAAGGKPDVIEFDLSEFDAPKPASTPAAPPAKPAPPAPPAAAQGIDLDLAAFDKALSASGKAEPPAAPAAKAAEPDLTADLDFKLGEAAPAAPATDGEIDLGGLTATEAAGDEEASVKLDLARAYLDMGETDMARGLLQEVASSGSAQQKREAQELLTRA